MLHFELSSWHDFSTSGAHRSEAVYPYPPGSIMQSPDRLVDVNSVAKGVREGWAFRNRSDC